jgi:hypothetical protein
MIAARVRVDGHPPEPFDALTLVVAAPDGELSALRLSADAQASVLQTESDLPVGATPREAVAAMPLPSICRG